MSQRGREFAERWAAEHLSNTAVANADLEAEVYRLAAAMKHAARKIAISIEELEDGVGDINEYVRQSLYAVR